MAGLQQSDKQFTLHARLLWVLRAHVEAYFKKHSEISAITNVKTTEVSGCVNVLRLVVPWSLIIAISCCFWVFSNNVFLHHYQRAAEERYSPSADKNG